MSDGKVKKCNAAKNQQRGLRFQMWRCQRGLCYLCGARLKIRSTVDHIRPRCAGGPRELGNIALTHKRCNSLKNDRRPKACETFFGAVLKQQMDDGLVALKRQFEAQP